VQRLPARIQDSCGAVGEEEDRSGLHNTDGGLASGSVPSNHALFELWSSHNMGVYKPSGMYLPEAPVIFRVQLWWCLWVFPVVSTLLSDTTRRFRPRARIETRARDAGDDRH
ncbi:unnamed protein product, partial [Ectocarpus sp. 13 AM-2016]